MIAKFFQGLCLFEGLCLLFLPIFPGSMLIWGSTLIKKSRVFHFPLTRHEKLKWIWCFLKRIMSISSSYLKLSCQEIQDTYCWLWLLYVCTWSTAKSGQAFWRCAFHQSAERNRRITRQVEPYKYILVRKILPSFLN